MINKDLNFIFFGTPDVASKTLDILKENGFLPSLIVTSLDKPQGRKMTITPPPVKTWAIENDIPFLQPEKITPEFISIIESKGADLSIVVAYGKILPEELIDTPRLGTINIHYSLLPKYRGASPVESALLSGDSKTGVSIQQMVYKLDSGPIIAREEVNIDINETKATLKEILISTGGVLLCEILPKIEAGDISPIDQSESEATFCKKINKEDAEIKIGDNPLQNYNKYRAFAGWPEVFFFANKNGKNVRVKIKEAVYENSLFIIKKVTPEGKNEMDYKDFLKQN